MDLDPEGHAQVSSYFRRMSFESDELMSSAIKNEYAVPARRRFSKLFEAHWVHVAHVVLDEKQATHRVFPF